MAHVFVAPHPGRCRAVLRRAHRQPARARPEHHDPDRLLRARAGNGIGPDELPARGARVRHEDALARDRGVQPLEHPRGPARRPGRRRVGRRRRPARGDPGGRGRVGQALLAARVVVPPGEHPQQVARGPGGDGRRLDAGRPVHRRPAGGGDGRRDRREAARRGRALRILRRGVGRVPGPARRRLPRLRGRRPAARARPSERRRADRDPAQARSRGSSRRRCTCRLAVGNHVDHQLCRDVGVSLLAEPRRWVMPGPEWAGQGRLLRGLPVRLVERLQLARRPPAGRPRRHPGRRPPDAALRGHQRPDRAQGPRHRAVREPDRPALRRCQVDGLGGAQARCLGRPPSAASPAPPSATGTATCRSRAGRRAAER